MNAPIVIFRSMLPTLTVAGIDPSILRTAVASTFGFKLRAPVGITRRSVLAQMIFTESAVSQLRFKSRKPF